ncbi:MAG: metallophosphoesterase [Clostridia bacterium]|nr:metallophosphoesterase [Clostridia bacterium]
MKKRFTVILLALMMLFSSCNTENSGGSVDSSSDAVSYEDTATENETTTVDATTTETTNTETTDTSANETTSEETSTEIEKPSELNLIYTSLSKGKLNATVILDCEDGVYELFYADITGAKLEKYTRFDEITVENGAGSVDISDLVIPPNAVKIVAVNKENATQYSAKISSDVLINEEQAYIFGVLSDVHFGRYNISGTGDDAIGAFDNALDHFDGLGVDFVAIAGDITSEGEEESFVKYNEAISTRDYEIFSCTGNHDVTAIDNGLWQQYMNKDAFDGTNAQIIDVASNGLDFVFAPDEANETGDVFIFLSQIRWSYNSPTSTLLSFSQINWLKSMAEKYKDKTVYLFFHTFLCGPDGEGHTGVGNIMNPAGYEYDLPYTSGCGDEKLFRSILKDYKNIIFFSGHSHWMFEMEKYNENTNFSNFDGEYGYMVHVPSVTEPRYIGDEDTYRISKNTENSQGWIIYAYDEYTLLVPVDFVTETYYTEYMEIIYTE